MNDLKLVFGLGNPGPQYTETRHNIGFRVLDRIAAHEGLIFETAKSLEGYTGPRSFQVARLFEPHVLLVKPETFMNRSGEVVRALAKWAAPVGEPDAEEPAHFDSSKLMVIYDDMDLDLGRLRLRPHGGAGTHNGLRSVVRELDSKEFPRLRVGVGPARGDVAEFVLSPFGQHEREDVEISIIEAAEATLDWMIRGDIDACMNRFQTRWNSAHQGP